MKNFQLIKQRGIGLLELMLSLAIIAILLIMATRYYQSASNSQAISSALDEVNAVKSGVKNFMVAGNATNFPSVSDLVDGGYLPSSYANPSSANPWSGEICIGTAGTITNGVATLSSCGTTAIAPTFAVILTGVPDSVCSELSNRLKGTINAAQNEGVSDCSGGSVSVTYAS